MNSRILPELPALRWTRQQTLAQIRAVAWLRWRIFVNGLRRKGSTADIVAIIVVAPVFALLALGASAATGWLAYESAANHELNRISWLLWGTFILCQFLNINMGQPGTLFDPTQLIRFPLKSRNYIVLRLFFGILSPANVMVGLMSLAVAIGVTIAAPWMWAYAFGSMAMFAITNAIFTRMVFAWVDRWLATRRAREVFTGLIFTVSLLGQWLNVRFNPAYNHHHGDHSRRAMTPEKFHAFTHGLHNLRPLIDFLPPGLIGNSLIFGARHQHAWYLAYVAGCGVFAFFFFTVFAARTRTEFRGEVLSDAANGVTPVVARAQGHAAPLAGAFADAGSLGSAANFSTRGERTLRLSPVVGSVFAKEILTIRRNTGIFYALIAPVVMVFLFAGRLAARNGPGGVYIFPAALTYALVGIIPLPFNSFGMEGPGAQLYFLLPVRLRDVFVAKNLVNFLLAYAETASVLGIVTYLTGLPSLNIIVTSVLWAAGTLLLTTTIGNRRSIVAPKRIDPGRTMGKQTSPASAFLGMGLLLVSAALGFGAIALTRFLGVFWIMPLVMVLFALAAGSVYLAGLRGIERYTMAHRDELFEELCKEASSSVRR